MPEQVSHTSGPWKVSRVSHEWNSPSSPRREIDAIVHHEFGGEPTCYRLACVHYPTTQEGTVGAEEREANARLIAAAPDLLGALKTLRIDANRLCDRCLGGTYEDDCRTAIEIADAAIAKAEGRA